MVQEKLLAHDDLQGMVFERVLWWKPTAFEQIGELPVRRAHWPAHREGQFTFADEGQPHQGRPGLGRVKRPWS